MRRAEHDQCAGAGADRGSQFRGRSGTGYERRGFSIR